MSLFTMNTTNETNLLNTSVTHLSRDDLQSEYDSIKKAFTASVADLDSKRQQIFNFQRERSRYLSVKPSYIQEVQIISNTKKNLNDQRHTAQEKSTNLQKTNVETLQQLEQSLASTKEEARKLRSEEKSGNGKSDAVRDRNAADIGRVLSEIEACKKAVSMLESDEEDYRKRLDTLEKLNESVNVICEKFTLKCTLAQKNYDEMKEELLTMAEKAEELEYDALQLQGELVTLKGKPLDDGTRGNSMFAEVNDRRKQLETNLKKMRERYIEMKQERSGLLQQIAVLQEENYKLSKGSEEYLVQQKIDRESWDSYQQEIVQLEELLPNLENCDAGDRTADDRKCKSEMQFMESMINRKQQELKAALTNLNALSKTNLEDRMVVCEINRELHEWKLSSLQFECEMDQLKTQLEMILIQSPNAKCDESEQVVLTEHSYQGVDDVVPLKPLDAGVQASVEKTPPRLSNAEGEKENTVPVDFHNVTLRRRCTNPKFS